MTDARPAGKPREDPRGDQRDDATRGSDPPTRVATHTIDRCALEGSPTRYRIAGTETPRDRTGPDMNESPGCTDPSSQVRQKNLTQKGYPR